MKHMIILLSLILSGCSVDANMEQDNTELEALVVRQHIALCAVVKEREKISVETLQMCGELVSDFEGVIGCE